MLSFTESLYLLKSEELISLEHCMKILRHVTSSCYLAFWLQFNKHTVCVLSVCVWLLGNALVSSAHVAT